MNNFNIYLDKNIVKIKSIEDFFFKIVEEANSSSASDIHLDQCEKYGLIRFRIMNEIIYKYRLRSEDFKDLISKLKIVAGLRIDGVFIQDGRISNLFFKDLEIRISILPNHFGESIVLRLNKKNDSGMSLDKIGFDESAIHRIRRAMSKSGVIIVSGSTGSGKTTTMYSMLNELNKDNLIVTIEDPVEKIIEGTRQISVNPRIGLTFSTGLRSILRQDPDVIMIGEIRDEETAKIALNSALTGHLVLATLHAKDSLSVISRLKEFGIDNYLICSTVRISIFQRLVGIKCNECTDLFLGCNKCHYTGVKEMKLLCEIAEFDERVLREILVGREKEIYEELGIKRIEEQVKELLDIGLVNYSEYSLIKDEKTKDEKR